MTQKTVQEQRLLATDEAKVGVWDMVKKIGIFVNGGVPACENSGEEEIAPSVCMTEEELIKYTKLVLLLRDAGFEITYEGLR